ncbi:MAG: polysaccharide deacetylase family protein [Oscillospiraceae bacterium]|nr:polysaccharide deacetylase family protein [Oscillospiraceae bacterium]
MATCPKCGNEVNDGKRICPVCGESLRAEARAAKRARKWIYICCTSVLMIGVFILGIVLALNFLPDNSKSATPTENTTVPTQTQPATKPTAAPTQPTTVPTEPTTAPTEPTTAPTEPTTAPTEPTAAPTEPTVPPTEAPTKPTEPVNDELIGTIYTRRQLMALDNTGHGYGPGTTSGGARPPYPGPLQDKYGKYGANFIAPDNGNIYLTFDCGYEHTATDANGNKYRVTEKILDVLKEKDVKAVFFVTMYYVKDQPDLVRRMIDEGHTVGNHSNNHPVMPEQTIDKMVYEVMSLHDYVKEHFGYEMSLFRFPTGEYSTRSLAVVQSLGYKSVHWSFAYLDYETESQPDPVKALERVTSSHHSGAIYLLHAISTTNASILGDAIDFFRAEGYNLELFA